MSFFKVTIDGLDTIKEDMEKQETEIDHAIPAALRYVGSEMVVNLQKYITDVWYKGYTPKQYKRRTDNPSLGTPIGSADNMDYSAEGRTLDFIFYPHGDHANPDWYTRDRDKIIESIQTGKLWGNPPPRPFWNMFVEEQKNEAIMRNFSKAMGDRNIKVEPEGAGKDIIFDGRESLLEAEDYPLYIQFSGFSESDDSDEELPF